MRAMSAEGKDQLHQELVAVPVLGVMRKPIFPAQLAEFAGPIRQRSGDALVGLVVEAAAVGPIESSAAEPAPPELIVPGGVKTKCALLAGELLPLAPD